MYLNFKAVVMGPYHSQPQTELLHNRLFQTPRKHTTGINIAPIVRTHHSERPGENELAKDEQVKQ
jgi:hypothetical protein